MNNRSVFKIDCSSIIPECGFKCSKCIKEIEDTLTSMEGVSKVYMEGKAENTKLIVEHDASIITVEQLMETFKKLPSFYEGFFTPTLIK
ncbi:MAG: heavy-metal-associated domain-containing protein [Candidatus Ratteibacteria bacterium]|nr:heavy-metal-associated domain-containing protein [Candidatus Ratteibacteria bacterium]